MPWTTAGLNALANEAKTLVRTYYPNEELTAVVMVATAEEIIEESIVEKKKEGRSESEIRRIQRLRSLIDGKYFKYRHEIWVVRGKGERLGTLVHEFLHSIQKCSPNRERIVEYLTYKLTEDPQELLLARMEEWLEIERSIGLRSIINQLLKERDCEEFG